MKQDIKDIVLNTRPEELYEPESLDHAEHVVLLALDGNTGVAADHLLHPEIKGNLVEIVGNITRQLNLQLMWATTCAEDTDEDFKEKILARARAYEVMIEIGLNLTGMEPKLIGLSETECEDAYQNVLEILDRWTERECGEFEGEAPVGNAVARKMLVDMKKIMAGDGMMAKLAEEIEPKIDEKSPVKSYLQSTSKALRENVYYQMTYQGLCKLGNDYAMGLRWLRHLGYVQVSTNPVLAAKAYVDIPELWNQFEQVVLENDHWHDSPEDFEDEIAMEATQVALWPNLMVFRPLFLSTNRQHGMVSYQLNPNVADSYEGSVEDALKIYSAATHFLREYDKNLVWGYSEIMERSRPNIVFKVAGSSPASLDITTTLDSLGIGTNNTVTYSVVQETSLIIRAITGMSLALKAGIPITQAYETNMGGRLESHLRDIESERILREALTKVDDQTELLDELVEGMDIEEELDSDEDKISAICSYSYLKSLENPAFVKAIQKSGAFGDEEETAKYLADLESDIGMSGTLVCQRVYWVFFSEENRPKWIEYLRGKFDLTQEQAEEVMGKIDMLPASKRKPMDTYLTMASRGMTNTEFPNHQYNVLEAFREEGFELSEFEDAVLSEHDPEIAERLLSLDDFKKAYEMNPWLYEQLKEAGIEPDFGDGGMMPEEWPNFGSVIKTSNQFKNAYEEFKEECVEFVKKVAAESE